MNPELKFLRLDYWGGHLYYLDDDDGSFSPCCLLNITDVLYVAEGDTSSSIKVYFREGYLPEFTAVARQNTQYVVFDLVASQTDNNVVIWLTEQIRNAFESDSAIYYPPTQPPVLFDMNDININS